MKKFNNTSSVPLSLAVFLAHDKYDYSDDPNEISATSLIKAVRPLVLSSRVPQGEGLVDLVNMVSLRMGTAIHDGIEDAWRNGRDSALRALGYPDHVISRVVVNPTDLVQVSEMDLIPIFIEQRHKRQVGKWTVTGKFDFIGEGRVEDFKSTSVYTLMNNTNDSKYILQGSIYRWLAPHLITKDEMAIQFIFTDWSKAKAMADPKYPQARIHQHVLPLKSTAETEIFIKKRLEQIEAFWHAPEEELPLCTDEDLWRSEPVFKYYKDPSKTARSTKNFDNKADAMLRFVEDGSKGLVKEVPGQATACKYCSAFSICSQKDALIASGDLVL